MVRVNLGKNPTDFLAAAADNLVSPTGMEINVVGYVVNIVINNKIAIST